MTADGRTASATTTTTPPHTHSHTASTTTTTIFTDGRLNGAADHGERPKGDRHPGSLVAHERMFTARAATRRIVIAESVDSAAINVFAGRVSGIESVGLKAIEFVNDRYR